MKLVAEEPAQGVRRNTERNSDRMEHDAEGTARVCFAGELVCRQECSGCRTRRGARGHKLALRSPRLDELELGLVPWTVQRVHLQSTKIDLPHLQCRWPSSWYSSRRSRTMHANPAALDGEPRQLSIEALRRS